MCTIHLARSALGERGGRRSRRLRRAFALAAVFPLCLVMAPRPSVAQTAVGQLLLRPENSHALLKSPGERQWRRAGQLAPVHRGDSVRLQSGSAELVFRSGARIPVPLWRSVAVSVPSEGARGGILAYMGAAVEAILDLTRGNASERETRGRTLEAPVARANPGPVRGQGVGGRLRSAARGAGATDSASTGVSADGVPSRPARVLPAQLRLPANVGEWPEVPGLAGVRWGLPRAAWPFRLTIHAASPGAECPGSGPLLADTTVQDSASLQGILAGTLRPGGAYRLDVRSGGAVKTACVRVASLEEESAMRAELDALRAEYGERADEADAALPMLEAALLARRGYRADALLRLQALVVRPDAPEMAVQLWRAIAAPVAPAPAPR